MRFLKIFLCCAQLCLISAALSPNEQLIGWQEFRLALESGETDEVVRKYSDESGFLVATENHLGFAESLVVPPDQVAGFQAFLSQQGVKFEILQKDVGGMLLKTKLANMQTARSFNNDPSTYFAKTSEIHSWIEGLAAANAGIARIMDIGKSYEGRRLLVLELSNNRAANKPAMFLDAAIHAREWLAPATLNYIIKQFISDYKAGDAAVVDLLNRYDWYFMPVINPDGYDYTFTSASTRFWRKTRKPYGYFYGADPNRNFDTMFAGVGTSGNPRSDIYHGPFAFSEPETKALSEFLAAMKARLQRGMYLSFHTYGQYWLTPPGFTTVNPSDHVEMVRIGNLGRDAILTAGGPEFAVGQPANIGLYVATGSSYDWVKAKLEVKYSFTLELRPGPGNGINGFAPEPSVIPTSGREIYGAVKAVASSVPPL